MRKKIYNLLGKLGFWIPCDKCLPDEKHFDWVMVSYYEPGIDYRYIPTIAEYSYVTGKWHDMSENGNKEFLNDVCRITHWRKIPNDRYLKRET